MPLDSYRAKRDFRRTPEPPPGEVDGGGSGRFVVGRHRATALHYDLRLEIDGVLVSWAVPKGPTLDPDQRRLAMRTEDHPIEYLEFEGVIPRGSYGGGDAIVWDWGTFEPEETADPGAALAAGELKFSLHGEKLRGRFTIIRTAGRGGRLGGDDGRDKWLLIHKRDEHAVDGWNAEDHPRSVKTGRTNDEVAANRHPRFEAPTPAADVLDLGAATPAPLPDFVPPMLASPGDGAFDDPGWLFEVKWDGYRVQLVVGGGRVRAWTRKRTDATAYVGALGGPPTWIAADEAVVDGELVALDPEGRPSFGLLQRAREQPGTPVAFYAFDLLHHDGRSLLRVPLSERKKLLRRVLRPHDLVRYASHVDGDGVAFVEAAASRGLEGVVAKRADSPYEPGRRVRTWLKIKLRNEQEVVVVGWLPGQGSHRDLGSLVVAVRDLEGDRWVHAGQVGSGLDAAMRRRLIEELGTQRRVDPPIEPKVRLPKAVWVEPRMVIRVEYAEWTDDGILRQAAFKGVEPGRDPREVVREAPVPVPRLRSTRASRRQVPEPEPAIAAKPAELAALDAMEREGAWTLGGHEVRLTNLDKVLFPAREASEPPVTKRDLIRYLVSVGPTLIPYLVGRGLTLQRFPNGIEAKGFWQKDLPGHAPEWVARWTYHHQREGPKDYVVVDRVATLAWLAQEAAVELHPWTSRTDAPEQPTYALIDVDPGPSTTWEEVLELTRLYRAALGHLGIVGVPKVTGKRGIQVWVPVRRGYTFDETRAWVEAISRAVGRAVPDLVSWEWSKRDRRGRARLDYTQNVINKTLVAPYSPRPAAGAPVSAPISWDELDDPALRPDGWTIRSMAQRLAEVGDRFDQALALEQELPPLDA